MIAKQGGQILRPDNGKKLVLVLMVAGLAVIVLTSVVYRFGAGGLVKPTGLPMTSSTVFAPSMETGQMPMEFPQGMLDALVQQGMSLTELGLIETSTLSGTEEIVTNSGSAIPLLPTRADDLDSILEMAEMFTRMGDLANAQSFINQALVFAPSDPRAYYQQSRIYLDLARNNFKQAAEFMERFLTLGESAQVRHDLALIYAEELNDKVRAIEHLNAAIALPGLSPDLKAHYQEELQALTAQ